ncbi:hypothetical protein M9H77_18392 [Catharanthus roseus]|uniref:Uncharacterized protein n=1 Tax=Catharanthus roseus TaxID=4058 RepID=A0ACC0B7A9_CATRO|nr:hypothetical protein M9H77_18392 [Catharanthus roseus]
MKGVIIKFYVETSRLRPQQRKENIQKSTHLVILPSSSKLQNTTRTQGYDRRAELLTYAQNLRNANAQRPPKWQPLRSSMSKHKKWRRSPSSFSFSKIRLSSPRLFYRSNRQCRYERINTEDYNRVQRSSRTPKIKRKSHFCEKFKRLIKEFSCGYQCVG